MNPFFSHSVLKKILDAIFHTFKSHKLHHLKEKPLSLIPSGEILTSSFVQSIVHDTQLLSDNVQ